MAHWNRWFFQLETSIYKGFSMAMLNKKRVNKLFLWQLSIANCKKLPEGTYGNYVWHSCIVMEKLVSSSGQRRCPWTQLEAMTALRQWTFIRPGLFDGGMCLAWSSKGNLESGRLMSWTPWIKMYSIWYTKITTKWKIPWEWGLIYGKMYWTYTKISLIQ